MDFSFKLQPFKHQLEGIEYGLNHDKWLLADEPGLGKSAQVIDIADARNVKHCLIICCVNGLKWNWLNEVHKHSDEEGYILGQRDNSIGSNIQRLEDLNKINELPRFIITNIETLKYRIPTGEKVEKVIRGRIKLVDKYRYPITERIQKLCETGQIEMIAIDEFSICKNDNTEQAKQILKLHAPVQIAITGTPVENSPLDVYMPLRWLGYEDRTFDKFKYYYCKFGGYENKEITGYKHLEEITSLLDTMMLRRMKDDVLDLPEKLFVDEYVEMGSKQASVYNAERKTLVKNINEIKSSLNSLTRFIRARQATGYPGIISDVKSSAKFDRMEEIIEDAVGNNKKVVIFSNWTQIVDPAYERLIKKYKGFKVTGEIKNRFNLIKSFQDKDDYNFIIGTIGAMGYGFNINAADIVIFLDEPSNKEKKNQAIDRCHRIGKSKNLTVYTLICQNTVDERIHNLVEIRGEISNILMNDVSDIDKNTLVNYLLS